MNPASELPLPSSANPVDDGLYRNVWRHAAGSRMALAGSTASTGYQIALERLKVHSMQIHGDVLVVDVDGDISVK